MSEQSRKIDTHWDVVVVGSGNAGASAALAAREAGARVLVVEKAPSAWTGGNSYFSAGAIRTTYGSLDDVRSLLDLTDREADSIDIPSYSAADFRADLHRLTQGRADPALAGIVADEAAAAVEWLARAGVTWRLLQERQSFVVDGRRRYWGNLVIGSDGGGRGLVEAELRAMARAGVEIWYGSPFLDFHRQEDRIAGAIVVHDDRRLVVGAGAVVLASGGFEADARQRAGMLGPGWDLAKVRGTPYNTGEVLFTALAAGAAPEGHWSGCHAISWDAAAPATGDREMTNRYSRQAYPFGLMVNQEGRRFVDEGADFRNYTYARYGARVLEQPGARAYQLFDARTVGYASTVDYDTATRSRAEAPTIEALADALGIDRATLAGTVETFNQATGPAAFNPTIKDGKSTVGLDIPKSNWAQPLTAPPFVAFAVTCGITFTFGGLRITTDGAVVGIDGRPLDGLFAAGEVAGGLFYHNYPGGSGLTAGTVLGRRAGQAAARVALNRRPPGSA